MKDLEDKDVATQPRLNALENKFKDAESVAEERLKKIQDLESQLSQSKRDFESQLHKYIQKLDDSLVKIKVKDKEIEMMILRQVDFNKMENRLKSELKDAQH